MAKDEEPTYRKGGLVSLRTELLIALVALITLIAIWLVPGEKEAPPSLPQPPAAPLDANQAPPSPAGGSTAAARSGDRARAIIAGLRADGAEPDPGKVFADAEQQQQAGNLDDAYLLYRYAANHGEARAALALGTQADPAYHSAANSILPGPEPEQAIKWYRMAVADGNKEAASRLKALRKRTEQAAAAGDEQAQRLLLQLH